MEIRLLGPVEVWSAGRPLDAGGPRQRGVLAALASEANRTLPMETLIDRVWDGRPPAHARHTLQAYVARLRKIIGSARLTCRVGAYTLTVGPDDVDVLRLQRLTARAHGPAVSDEMRADLLRKALELWRGVPLAGLPGHWAARTRQLWSRQRLDIAVAWATAELRHGDVEAVIRELETLAYEHHLSEPLAETLMRALAVAGRPSEALARYADLRQCLADDLGCDPGPTLQRLHLAMLRAAQVGTCQLPG
jgi:DNA-binding SARP family transcriptional activator